MRGRKCDCNVSPPFPKTYIGFLMSIYHFFCWSPKITSIPQPPGSSSSVVCYFRQCHSVVLIFYEEQCFCSAYSFLNVLTAARQRGSSGTGRSGIRGTQPRRSELQVAAKCGLTCKLCDTMKSGWSVCCSVAGQSGNE
jgi:hypothetical protein